MHVIHPATYQPKPVPKQRRKAWLVVPVLVIFAAGYNYARPLPAPTASLSVPGLSAHTAPAVAWPTQGQAAIGAPGYGILGTFGAQQPLATASTAKVILALCVLQKQPLNAGAAGTTYTVSAHDVDIYTNYVAQNGSVAAVSEDEQLSEYQALQALMLPSANNIADSLAGWVFGSQANYQAFAANYLTISGLSQTTIGTDASGYDPGTTSTATDLTKLGLLALKSPVLMEIAGQHSANLPVAGIVYNHNAVIGSNGINGLKTGNNDQDLGAFVFTATVRIGSQQLPVTGAVMDAPDVPSALASARNLSDSLRQGFEQVTVASSGKRVGSMQTAWGASEPIVTSTQIQLVHWKGTALSETHKLQPTLHAGNVGSLQISGAGASAKASLLLAHRLTGPSFWWRLTRH
jgi:D-alanyl-D-alanine carboxypeptidase (penicillin-binding protein 5/6)